MSSTEEEHLTNSEYDSDSSISSEEERKKTIPAHIRLRDAIKQKKDDRKKGTKKEKENYDE